MWGDTILLGLVGVKCFTPRDAIRVRWDLQSSGVAWVGGERVWGHPLPWRKRSRLWWNQGSSSDPREMCTHVMAGPRLVFISCPQASKRWLLPPPVPSEQCPVPLSVW